MIPTSSNSEKNLLRSDEHSTIKSSQKSKKAEKGQYDANLEKACNELILRYAYLSNTSIELVFALVKLRLRGDMAQK